MGGFSILTNRKRAIVALVHSVVFLLIAVRQMFAAQPSTGIWVASTVSRGTWILCGIFAIVSAILFWLLVISSGWMEKFYFAFCTISASSGLVRTAAGDQTFHAGLYIRVVMLVSAVLVGLLIVRMHSRRFPAQSRSTWKKVRNHPYPPPPPHVYWNHWVSGCMPPKYLMQRAYCQSIQEKGLSLTFSLWVRFVYS